MNSLRDGPALPDDQVSVLEGRELAHGVLARIFECLRGFLVDAVRGLEGVGDAELFEQPDGADGARGLEEVDGEFGHGLCGGGVFVVVGGIG